MNSAMASKAWQMLKQTCIDWARDHCTSQAAAIAFYAIFSFVPLLILVVMISSSFYGDEAATHEAQQQMRQYIAPQAAELVGEVLAAGFQSGRSTVALVTSIVGLLYGATAVFGQVQQALNTVWKAPCRGEPAARQLLRYLWRRLLALVMVLVSAAVFVMSMALGAAGLWLRPLVQDIAGTHWHVGRVYNMGISLLAMSLMLAMIYKVLPDVRIRWRDVWIGAATTAAAILASGVLIGLYISHAQIASAYGAAGSLVVLLVWVYLTAMVFLLGAEFTHVYASRRPSARVLESSMTVV